MRLASSCGPISQRGAPLGTHWFLSLLLTLLFGVLVQGFAGNAASAGYDSSDYSYDRVGQLAHSSVKAGDRDARKLDAVAVRVSDRDGSLLRLTSEQVAPTSLLDDASRAAFDAADDIGSFSVKLKHLPGSGGRYNKFDYGVDPNAAIQEALRSDAAQFLPNPNLPDTFRVVTDLGRPIGTRGESTLRVIVGLDGQVINAFPVKVR